MILPVRHVEYTPHDMWIILYIGIRGLSSGFFADTIFIR